MKLPQLFGYAQIMSRMLTFIFVFCAGLLGPLYAGQDPLRLFSTCTGRLSAQMEHEWLMSDPAAESSELAREVMISLLETVMSGDDGPRVLSWRIDAKHAQAALLTRATFNDDAEDARWARSLAVSEIAACKGLLLS